MKIYSNISCLWFNTYNNFLPNLQVILQLISLQNPIEIEIISKTNSLILVENYPVVFGTTVALGIDFTFCLKNIIYTKQNKIIVTPNINI